MSARDELAGAEVDAFADLALLYGTFLVGRWAEVMSTDEEPADDWQEQAAREAVELFAPAAARLLDEARAEAWGKGYRSGHSNAMRRMSDEPNAPTTPNPYRDGSATDA